MLPLPLAPVVPDAATKKADVLSLAKCVKTKADISMQICSVVIMLIKVTVIMMMMIR